MKTETLEQVNKAFEIVENARADKDLTDAERLDLQKASVKLKKLESTIIEQKSNELVASLTKDSKELSELADEIIKSASKLADVANAIKKAAGVVEVLASVTAKAVSSGLI
jgi:hypothetical protein